MTEHTPGPWLGTVSGQFVRKIDISGKWPDWNICKVNLNASADNGATGRANARLIAAAPVLLEACKKLVEAERAVTDNANFNLLVDATDMARDAIAIAEGKNL